MLPHSCWKIGGKTNIEDGLRPVGHHINPGNKTHKLKYRKLRTKNNRSICYQNPRHGMDSKPISIRILSTASVLASSERRILTALQINANVFIGGQSQPHRLPFIFSLGQSRFSHTFHRTRARLYATSPAHALANTLRAFRFYPYCEKHHTTRTVIQNEGSVLERAE